MSGPEKLSQGNVGPKKLSKNKVWPENLSQNETLDEKFKNTISKLNAIIDKKPKETLADIRNELDDLSDLYKKFKENPFKTGIVYCETKIILAEATIRYYEEKENNADKKTVRKLPPSLWKVVKDSPTTANNLASSAKWEKDPLDKLLSAFYWKKIKNSELTARRTEEALKKFD